MDVLCVGMYRACSTWQYEVAAHLVEKYHRGKRLGFVQSAEFGSFSAAATWRVLKAHEGGPAFGRAIAKRQALALYAIRDPRDVVYSMLHKRGQDFEAFLRQGMIHQILANHQFFMSRRGSGAFLVQRYEHLVRDPAEGVREIGAHLGIALSPHECASIADAYSFSSNQTRTRTTAERMSATGLDPSDPSNAVCYDPHSLLHWNHLRRGDVGGWRDEATPRERAILARLLGRWVAEHGYDADTDSGGALTSADVRAIFQGHLACTMRCMSARFPRASAGVKRMFGMASAYEAKPVAESVDSARAA